MKLLLFITACTIMLVIDSCEKKADTTDNHAMAAIDSLQRVIVQKDNDINDMLDIFNQIEDGLRIINQAENNINLVKDKEGATQHQVIMDNMQSIADAMQQNRALIAKLQKQLKESSIKGNNLQKTIDNLVAELEEKEKQLQHLREELNAKDIHISELDETINNLNSDVAGLRAENSEKSSTISSQDKQLHTAWYVFGTKKELKEQRIIDGDKVLESSFNKSYFTKIDIRIDKEIKLYSKSAKLLTSHPSDSYSMQKDVNDQYILRINDPELFWSTSKYLVVLVK